MQSKEQQGQGHWFSGFRQLGWRRGAALMMARSTLFAAESPATAQPLPATVYTKTNSPLPDNTVTALCYDAPRARLWVGTDFGLARLETAGPGAPRWTVYHAAAGGLPADGIRALALADSTGTALWVGTFQGGLARLDVMAGTWEVWNAATSPLPLDHIRALAPEPDGGVWIGTAGGLAHRSRANAWRVFTPANSALTSGNVASVVLDKRDSTVWAGTINGGLARWRRGQLRTYTLLTDNLPDNTVLTLVLDSLRRPVFGTAAAGLVRYLTDSTWAAYGPRTSANPAATVLAVAADSIGRWWLGTVEHGLVGWERGQWVGFPFGSGAGLPDSTVQAIAVGATDELWLGLRSGGLARWRPGPLGLQPARPEAANLLLWPNPVSRAQGARARWTGQGIARAQVFDSQGKIVWQTTSRLPEVGLPTLPAGVYAVRVTVGAQVLTRRLLVGLE